MLLISVYFVATASLSLTAADRSQLEWFFGSALVMALAGVLLYRRNALGVGAVLVLGVTARLAVFWLPPGLSDDAFRYLWDGYVQHAGLNPFAATPAQLGPALQGDLYGRLNSTGFFSVYPPLSQLLFWISTIGEPQDWRQAWYVWKAICLLAEIGTLWLLRSTGARAMMLYALHPLPVVEMVGQAHTEAIMVFGLALACRSAASSQPLRAGFGWAIAAMTKLYPVLLGPFLVRSWKEGRRVLPAALLMLGLAALYWTPRTLGNTLSSLRLYAQYYEFNAGPYYAIKETLRLLTGADFSKQIGPLLAVGFGVAWLLRVRSHFGAPKPFAHQAYWTLGAFLLLSTTVHPWYLAGILVVLPFVPSPGWHWQALAVASLATYSRYVEGPYALVVAVGWLLWLFLFLIDRWRRPRSSSA